MPARSVWTGLLSLSAAGVVWGTIGPAVDVVHNRTSLSVLVIGAYRAAAAVAVLTLRWPSAAGRLRAWRW